MNYMKILRALIIMISLMALWQGIVSFFHLPDYILPGPFLVAKAFMSEWQLLLTQSLPTLIETLLGLGGAVILGCLTAIAMSYIRLLQPWLRPLLLISQALPTFAIAPLFVIWLGYGMSAKVATTMLMLFFPVASAFFDGLSRTDAGWLDLASVAGASRFRTFLHIRIPAALPNLVTGLRVATAAAPIGAVVGEWVGSSKGLGFLMLNANARMQIDVMFAALLMLILWSLLLYFSMDFLLSRYVNWQKEG